MDSPALKSSCVCVGCVLKLWEAPISENKSGVLAGVKRLWKRLRNVVSDPKDKLRLRPGAIEAWLVRKTETVLKHDRDVTIEYVIEDLKEFTHFYAGSQGRAGARDLSLTDFYRLVDWIRRHPSIPGFLHDVTWSTIENTGAGLGFVVDSLKIVMAIKTGGALVAGFSLTPTLEAASWAGTVASKETTGKSLFTHAYESVFAKMGLNLNVKRAFVHWLAGKLVVELYRKP